MVQGGSLRRLGSCHRQADNLYRLYLATDEHEPHGDKRASGGEGVRGHAVARVVETTEEWGDVSGGLPMIVSAIRYSFMISEGLAVRRGRDGRREES